LTGWTFLSNHAHVLRLLYLQPDLRMRDIADKVGITERAVQRIVHDLANDEYITITKEGRRNTYTANLDKNLRHPLEANVSVRQFLAGIPGGVTN